VIRVWDLVLKKEVAVMKPKGQDDNMAHMTTSILFTNDRKTIISGGRDGCLHFWNAMDGYKLLASLRVEDLGAVKYEEINCMTYVAGQKDDPCLVIGGLSGQISVYSINRQRIVFKARHSQFNDPTKLREEGDEAGFDPQNNQSNEIQ